MKGRPAPGGMQVGGPTNGQEQRGKSGSLLTDLKEGGQSPHRGAGAVWRGSCPLVASPPTRAGVLRACALGWPEDAR